jgi:hypothetical protein
MNNKLAVNRELTVHDDLAKSAARAADDIYSSFITEKFDDIFLIYSLEFILIALGSHFVIRITSGDTGCAFDTGETVMMSPSERIVEFPAGVSFRVFRAHRDLAKENHEQLEKASSHLELILSKVRKCAGADSPRIGKRINSAINILREKLTLAAEARNAYLDKSSQNVSSLDSLFNRLDPLMLAASDICFFPNEYVEGGRCLRLFFFHRISPHKKTHMQLHPLANQLQSAAGEYLRAAKMESWNFDEIVNKGLASWIRWPWDQSKDRGGLAFKIYLDRLTQGQSDKIDDVNSLSNHSGLAVPMHVGGRVWLVVLFVFDAREKNRVELAHFLLSRTVPILFENIASVALEEYLGLIRDGARVSFRCGVFDINDLNARLHALARSFPYKEWYLSPKRNEFGIVAFGETNYLHELSPETTTEMSDFEFRMTFREAIRDRLKETLQNAAHEAQYELGKEQEVRQEADEGIGHALKNILELTNWSQAHSQISSLIKNFNRLIVKERHDEILHRLLVANRAFGLFSLVAGLANFARLRGAISRSDYAKIVQWHDADELRRWTSGRSEDVLYVCDSFAGTLCRIVASLCSSLSIGREPQLFEVRCDSAQPSVMTSDNHNEPDSSQFDKRVLHVPPFKKGSDAVYSFVFALTEPLVNALHALEEMRKNPNFSPSERTLRIHIVPRLPDEVMFSIVNTSAVRLQKTLSGFETTRRMLRHMGIAELSNPKVKEIRSGAYEVVTEVHFRPYCLAKKIAEGIGQ